MRDMLKRIVRGRGDARSNEHRLAQAVILVVAAGAVTGIGSRAAAVWSDIGARFPTVQA